jgi:hypothetical protein
VTTEIEIRYHVVPAEWQVTREPWVRAALRVVENVPSPGQPARMIGFLFDRSGELCHLNDVVAVRRLGQRLDRDLDPVAYAEILAEFYSGEHIEGPVVTAWAPGPSGRPGWLVRDVAAAAAEIPWVDANLLAAPTVRRSDDGVTVEFVSWHQIGGLSIGIDVLRWTVSGGPGRDAVWERRYLAMQVEMPWPDGVYCGSESDAHATRERQAVRIEESV